MPLGKTNPKNGKTVKISVWLEYEEMVEMDRGGQLEQHYGYEDDFRKRVLFRINRVVIDALRSLPGFPRQSSRVMVNGVPTPLDPE